MLGGGGVREGRGGDLETGEGLAWGFRGRGGRGRKGVRVPDFAGFAVDFLEGDLFDGFGGGGGHCCG